MKKLLLISLVAFASLFLAPTNIVVAKDKNPNTLITKETDQAKAARLLNRLEVINAMDKTSLSRAEKRSLRKEVKSTKESLEALSGGGLYLSVGAIIIIILLLVILI